MKLCASAVENYIALPFPFFRLFFSSLFFLRFIFFLFFHTVAPRFRPGLVGARLIPPFPAEMRRKPTCFSEVVLVSFYVYRGIGESRGSQSQPPSYLVVVSQRETFGRRFPCARRNRFRVSSAWNYAGTTGINERDGGRGGERAVTESSGAKILSPPPPSEYVLEVATFMYTE